MDAVKTGKFIAEVRKELNMTQKQLADELGISDKTVSKWECGKGMPDIEMIGPLCQYLHINVNELISGERLSEKNYSDYAEGNMISLMKESKEAQKKNMKRIINFITGVVLAALTIACMTIMSGMGISGLLHFLDVPSIILIIMLTFIILWGAGRVKDFGRAIWLISSEKETEISEEARDLVESAIEAVHVTRKALIYSGVFIALFSIIVIMGMLDDPAALGPNLAVAILSLLYGIIGAMITIPMESRLKTLIK